MEAALNFDPLKKFYRTAIIKKISSAFLPTVVYHLEEYGLPRMLARKLHNAGIINFDNENLTLDVARSLLANLKVEEVVELAKLEPFDKYIYEYFIDGIIY